MPLFQNTSKDNCYRSIMEGNWLDIFLVTNYAPHFVITGGERICMLMPLPFAEIVLNVPWLLEQVDHQ